MNGLTAYHLKWIAIISMVMDHIGMVFFPDAFIFRLIGRMSFVIFSFLLVEGFVHTKNLGKYLKQLLFWAVLSEIPFDLALSGKWFDPSNQNIFFTLSASLYAISLIASSVSSYVKIAGVLTIIACAIVFRFDYSYLGILQVILFYIFRNHVKWIKFGIIGVLNAFLWGRFLFQAWAMLAFLPISQYNGEKGRKAGKLFYSFYATHLLIIGIVKRYFWN